MDLDLVRRGVVLGFAVAAPVGPIGVLVIRRSIAHGAAIGVATGLGVATSDAVFALAGALGLAAAASLAAGSVVFRIAGALMLAYLGVRTLLARPAEPSEAASRSPPSHARAFASTFVLTLANPATILSFAAAFAALGGGVGSRAAAVVFASSVFAGSMAWWIALSAGVSVLRARVSARALRVVNVGSGLLIVGFAVASLAR